MCNEDRSNFRMWRFHIVVRLCWNINIVGTFAGQEMFVLITVVHPSVDNSRAYDRIDTPDSLVGTSTYSWRTDIKERHEWSLMYFYRHCDLTTNNARYIGKVPIGGRWTWAGDEEVTKLMQPLNVNSPACILHCILIFYDADMVGWLEYYMEQRNRLFWTLSLNFTDIYVYKYRFYKYLEFQPITQGYPGGQSSQLTRPASLVAVPEYVPFDWRAEGSTMVINSSNETIFWRAIFSLDALGICANDWLLWISSYRDEVNKVTWWDQPHCNTVRSWSSNN